VTEKQYWTMGDGSKVEVFPTGRCNIHGEVYAPMFDVMPANAPVGSLVRTKPEPRRLDVVHPNLKRDCSVIILSKYFESFYCEGCGGHFLNRNYLTRYKEGFFLCSWNCAVYYTDYFNWNYENGRKGISVNIIDWREQNPTL